MTLSAPFNQAVFVPITPAGVMDPDGDTLTFTASSIFQDEPLTGAFDATLSPITVRKWRSANPALPARLQTGRVYTINYVAADPSGASCTGVLRACLPRIGGVCVDEGPTVNSTP